MNSPEKIRLGDLLIQKKLITEEQLAVALETQKRNGLRLGRILVNKGFVTEVHISEALARQFDIPFIDLRNFNIKPEQVHLLNESDARRLHAIVLEENKGRLLVGLVDPTDTNAIEEVRRIVGRDIAIAVVTEGDFLAGMDRGYWRTRELGGSE